MPVSRSIVDKPDFVKWRWRLLLALMSALVTAIGLAVDVASQEPSTAQRWERVRGAVGNSGQLRSATLKASVRVPNLWYEAMSKVAPGTTPFITLTSEIRMLLPNHYVVFSTHGVTGRQSHHGISGTDYLRSGARAPDIVRRRELENAGAQWAREDFGRLVFQVFLNIESMYPFRLRGATGGGETRRFTERDGTDVWLDLDATTNLPKRFRFSMRTQSLSPSAAGTRQNIVVDVDDFRRVGTWNLPHKLIETREGKFHSETLFDSIEVNPPLTVESFKAFKVMD